MTDKKTINIWASHWYIFLESQISFRGDLIGPMIQHRIKLLAFSDSLGQNKLGGFISFALFPFWLLLSRYHGLQRLNCLLLWWYCDLLRSDSFFVIRQRGLLCFYDFHERWHRDSVNAYVSKGHVRGRTLHFHSVLIFPSNIPHLSIAHYQVHYIGIGQKKYLSIIDFMIDFYLLDITIQIFQT